VPIPVGFAYVEGTKKDTGLIVVDGYGNEFVWVPVNTVLAETMTVVDELVESNFDDADYGIDAELLQEDFDEMSKSVDVYNGFYVGRYETSWNESAKRVASVADVYGMTGATPVDEFYDTKNDTEKVKGSNWYTFYREQKKLHENTDSVVSGMIYGSQWDAIMEWMKDIKNPYITDYDAKYISNSTGMGHYYWDDYGNLIPGLNGPIKTGSNSNYKVNNIYDLAGNYWEWTMSKSSARNMCRECRGGGFDGGAITEYNFPAESYDDMGLSPSWNYPEIYSLGSRLQLYIK